ncbi:hypothetical protein SteCoe_24121 [Stentor coeruleus]|uniref:Uncharacterized protein n=1 Tax=Stentor coeruleus TaxID=5963 RepID=A0A1R2BID1_9CILI|nr:hypothetical protein SteCoe_24121 [Stentor coeruleus]
MNLDHRDLISSSQISQNKKLHNRPLSAKMQGNCRDKDWLRLFHRTGKAKANSKTSRLQPYSARPPNPHINIHPKFTVNAISLYKVMNKVSSLDTIPENKPFILKNFPEYSGILGKTSSFSHLNMLKTDSIPLFTSRPNTATARPTTATTRLSRPATAATLPISSRNIWSARRDSENTEILPQKGREFVREVKKMWEWMDKGQDPMGFEEDKIEEDELIEENTLDFKTQAGENESLHDVGVQHTPVPLYVVNEKPHIIPVNKEIVKEKNPSISIQAKQKVLTERSKINKKPLFFRSRSYKSISNTSSK